jgi:hypothetical protein
MYKQWQRIAAQATSALATLRLVTHTVGHVFKYSCNNVYHTT